MKNEDHIDGMGQAKERDIMQRIYAEMDEQQTETSCQHLPQPAKSDSTPTPL